MDFLKIGEIAQLIYAGVWDLTTQVRFSSGALVLTRNDGYEFCLKFIMISNESDLQYSMLLIFPRVNSILISRGRYQPMFALQLFQLKLY